MSAAGNVDVNVEILLEGMIALLFERDGAGQIVGCRAGVIRDAPGHNFLVTVQRVLPTPADLPLRRIASDLRLDVQPKANPTFVPGQIDRQTGEGVNESFGWVLDLDEFYGFEIGAKKRGFISILHMNGGEFFTHRKSDNKLVALDEDEQVSSSQTIGVVATHVGVRVRLNGAASSAEFFNGSTSIFKAGQHDKYSIEVVKTRPHALGGAQHQGDANFFYTALGHKIPKGQKKVFSSTPMGGPGGVAPEASCLVPGVGRSLIEP